jgi:hypothetical protein
MSEQFQVHKASQFTDIHASNISISADELDLSNSNTITISDPIVGDKVVNMVDLAYINQTAPLKQIGGEAVFYSDWNHSPVAGSWNHSAATANLLQFEFPLPAVQGGLTLFLKNIIFTLTLANGTNFISRTRLQIDTVNVTDDTTAFNTAATHTVSRSATAVASTARHIIVVFTPTSADANALRLTRCALEYYYA